MKLRELLGEGPYGPWKNNSKEREIKKILGVEKIDSEEMNFIKNFIRLYTSNPEENKREIEVLVEEMLVSRYGNPSAIPAAGKIELDKEESDKLFPYHVVMCLHAALEERFDQIMKGHPKTKYCVILGPDVKKLVSYQEDLEKKLAD